MSSSRTKREIQPWDSDHTSLVHVLWAARREGIIPRETDCDLLASRIMQSKWMRAVKLHASHVRPAPCTTKLPNPEALG